MFGQPNADGLARLKGFAVVVLIAALCLFMLTLLTGAIEGHPFTRMLDRPSRVAELMANVTPSALLIACFVPFVRSGAVHEITLPILSFLTVQLAITLAKDVGLLSLLPFVPLPGVVWHWLKPVIFGLVTLILVSRVLSTREITSPKAIPFPRYLRTMLMLFGLILLLAALPYLAAILSREVMMGVLFFLPIYSGLMHYGPYLVIVLVMVPALVFAGIGETGKDAIIVATVAAVLSKLSSLIYPEGVLIVASAIAVPLFGFLATWFSKRQISSMRPS